MSSVLKKNIKHLLEENSMTATELERRAGLRPSAISNILYGRSKSPSINTLRAIADEFDTDIDFLFSAEESNSSSIQNKSQNNASFDIILARKAFDELARSSAEIEINATLEKFLACVLELYEYSSESNISFIDKRFAKWLAKEKLMKP